MTSDGVLSGQALLRAVMAGLGAWRVVLGLPLLWVCAYCLPLMGEAANYFRPRTPDILLVPSFVALAVLIPLHAWAWRGAGRWRSAAQFVLVVTGLCLACLCAFNGADYSWPRLMESLLGPDKSGLMKPTARVLCVLGFSAATALAWRAGRRETLARVLGSLGVAFLALLAVRVVQQDALPPAPISRPAPALGQPSPHPTVAPASDLRRVVWVIFDEMDEQAALAQAAAGGENALPNFERLRSRALVATSAWSPARDTVASLPALLMGRRVSGYRYLGAAQLALTDPDSGGEFRFEAAQTVFARLPGGLASGSLSGFYHPYCAILPQLGHCQATFLALAGRPADALTYLVPKFVHPSLNEHYRVTEAAWPDFLSRVRAGHDALTFGHINVPHLPAAYVRQRLGLPLVRDEAGMYRQNLRLADALLGELVQALEAPGAPSTLLIVSSDHWWRALSPRKARPVPYILWRVGSREHLSLDQPVSTVHTARLVETVLAGQLSAEPRAMADWLTRLPFTLPWIPPLKGGDPEHDPH